MTFSLATALFVSLGLLLWFAYLDWKWCSLGAKMTCSSIFLWFGIYRNSLPKSGVDVFYGRVITIALFFALLGDLLIAFDGEEWFISAVVAFMLTHIMYTIGFASILWQRFKSGTANYYSLVSVLLFIVVTSYIVGYRIIIPQIPSNFVGICYGYMYVISTMVAFSSAGENLDLSNKRGWMRVLGSVLFYASDICVARNAFIQRSFYNSLIGLPLYFAAQMIIAATI